MGTEEFKVRNGTPLPLGVSSTPLGTNFAIYSRDDNYATLLLFRNQDLKPTLEFKLNAAKNRTGHVWHCELCPAVPGWAYLWRIGKEKDRRWKSNDCLDPYARILDSPVGPSSFNDRSLPEYFPRALVPSSDNALYFDWQDVPKPKIPWHELVIYELHVRGFSKLSPETAAGSAGTFVGIIERIPYFKSLGVNCLELLPIMEFNEREWSHVNPETKKVLSQYWGYSTVAFFTAMNRYGRDGSTPEQVVSDFKLMVRELHRAGIEVVLDVVYNHTAEMGLDFKGPGHYGMKTLAPFSYYILQNNGEKFVNHSGCGNTVNCNNPIVQDLIVDSLKYWSHEMGVDGFRFDLASVLCRDTDGNAMEKPPVVERITKDPTTRDVKLIAEPWDCGGLYQVGSFPHFGAWAEWNGKFRDCARRFVKGDVGMIGEFATRLCGSEDLYKDGRKPHHSINFITAHDGFSMHDMVSYNTKRNHHNGENNNDGENHNDSWNCGVEGETQDPEIRKLRSRQMKNFMVALLVSTGTPMLNMGDEFGHTKRGNNNGWCQDSELTWFSWEAAKEAESEMVRFTRLLVHFRHNSPALQRDNFLAPADITWHGFKPHKPDWHSQYNFIAFVLHAALDVYVAFNAGGNDCTIILPEAQGVWHRVVDTNLPPPRDFMASPVEKPIPSGSYNLAPYSAVVLTQVEAGSSPVVDSSRLESIFEILRVDEVEAGKK